MTILEIAASWRMIAGAGTPPARGSEMLVFHATFLPRIWEASHWSVSWRFRDFTTARRRRIRG